jgi:tRNA threonylcarbamoyladenosine biosynthesis protein TsaE
MKIFTFNSVADTQGFAESFALKIPSESVVGLIGNLGTGKTTFTQGFAKGLGVKDHVISPTFKLVSEYDGDDLALNHVDCYRLDQPVEFLNIGGENFLNPENGITLIEWAERIKPYWSDDWIFIHFNRVEGYPNTRLIQISGIEL